MSEKIEKFEKIIEIVKERNSIRDLNEVQKKCIENYFIFLDNVVVSSPTASGKTIIAELAIINSILNNKKKALYVVPLRSLANEKYKEFLEKYESIGIKVGISTGDFDSPSEHLKNYDIIVLTIEKLDSLIRHGASWLKDVGCVVIDEIHLLNDINRGPTLEITIVKIKRILKDVQIIGLSATIPNYEEIAKWLNAIPIYSNYRPIELREGVLFNKYIFFGDGSKVAINSTYIDDVIAIVDYVVNKLKKQILIFVKSKKSAESLASKLSKVVKKSINPGEQFILKRISSEILNEIQPPPQICCKLAEIVKNGVSFHHSGLTKNQRELIEENFRNGYIKAIVATPTLAMGVNLPSTFVLVKDYIRFSKGKSEEISVMEYKQFVGRAGRPKYDKVGYGLILAREERDIERLIRKYINGEVEKVISKITYLPMLRFHVLSLISDEFVTTIKELSNFFKDTLYYHQFGEMDELLSMIIGGILKELKSWGFIEICNENLKITRIGKRVSQLYIDPQSAKIIIDGLNVLNSGEKEISEIGILDLLCRCTEIPGVSIKKDEITTITLELEERLDKLLLRIPTFGSHEFYLYLEKFKVALSIENWINEKSEKEICETFDIHPGELYLIRTNLEWMCYCAKEISKVLEFNKEITNYLSILEKRIKHGVKEDILELTILPGIGRVKARKLYNSGIKNLNDVINANRILLEKIVGRKTVEKIIEFLKKK